MLRIWWTLYRGLNKNLKEEDRKPRTLPPVSFRKMSPWQSMKRPCLLKKNSSPQFRLINLKASTFLYREGRRKTDQQTGGWSRHNSSPCTRQASGLIVEQKTISSDLSKSYWRFPKRATNHSNILQQAYDWIIWKTGLLLEMQNIGIKGNLYFWIKPFPKW